MSRALQYRRIITPGLPAWPRLYFDARNRRAYVYVRVPSWRSWMCAELATKLLVWCFSGAVAFLLWDKLAMLRDPVSRISLTAMGFGLAFAFAKPFTHTIFDGFFARQIFSTRTKIFFTRESVSFRGRLYRKGVVIWRHWKGEPVEPRFDVAQDYDAADFASSPYQTTSQVQRRRQSAYIVRLIVAVASSHRLATSNSMPLMRAIPILEVDQRDAPRIATVLSAASAMTACAPQFQLALGTGIDIDVAR